MAHLWIQEAGTWAVFPLTGTRCSLAELPLESSNPRPAALLARTSEERRADWHLVTTAGGIAVNGLPVAGGLRTLSDRDEIWTPATGPLFYSTERLARVEPLPLTGHEVPCPRCGQAIAPGSAAVCCPGCEVWHHGSEELPCWSYAPSCALCSQETAADAGFRWTPEELS